MLELAMIVALVLLVGAIVHTIVIHYTTSRITRVWLFMIAVLGTVPALVIALIGLLGGYDAAVQMWSLAVCGILAGYWLKSPFRILAIE